MYSENGTGDGGFAKFLEDYSTNKYDIKLSYIKIVPDLFIKIEWNQSILDEDELHWTYASLKNDEEDMKLYYFYVIGISWISENTIQLQLSMDTVATYWTDIQGAFTDKTTVVREHRDRFVKPAAAVSVGTTLTRKVDDVSEGVTAAQEKVKDEVIHRENDDHKWYLVYRTNTTSIDKPIDMWLCPSEQMTLSNSSSEQTYYTGDMDQTSVIVFTAGTYTVVGKEGTYTVTIEEPAALGYINERWQLDFKTGSTSYTTITHVTSFSGNTTIQTWYMMDMYHFNDYYRDTSYSARYIVDTSKSNFLPYDKAIQQNVESGDVKGINSVNRTYSNLNAIIECPYLPTDLIVVDSVNKYKITYYDKTVLQYSAAQRMFKFVDLEYDLTSTINDNYNIPDMKYTLVSTDLNNAAPRNDALESKILHSDFTTLKFVYDSFSLPYNRELIGVEDAESDVQVRIHYKQSNNISSSLLFDIEPTTNNTYKDNSDYPNLLISQRNNEMPIYQSEYLNYMRTGYNYDKKQMALQTTTNVINTVSQVAKAGLSLGLGLGAKVLNPISLLTASTETVYSGTMDEEKLWFGTLNTGGTISGKSMEDLRTQLQQMNKDNKAALNPISSQMMVSNASGIISSIANSVIQHAQQENSFQKKMAGLQAQSATISTNDDLNLFNYYNGNKLHCMVYDIKDSLKGSLYDMFYYIGYATNQQHIPDLYSRYN